MQTMQSMSAFVTKAGVEKDQQPSVSLLTESDMMMLWRLPVLSIVANTSQ